MKVFVVLIGLLAFGCQTENPVTPNYSPAGGSVTPAGLCTASIVREYRVEASSIYSVIGGGGSTIDLWGCVGDSLRWESNIGDTSHACVIMGWAWSWLDTTVIPQITADLVGGYPPAADTTCPNGVGYSYYRVVATYVPECEWAIIVWYKGTAYQSYRKFYNVPDSLDVIDTWLRETVACGVWEDIRDLAVVENCDCPGE